MSRLPYYPFEPELTMGTVVETSPSSLHINLPLAAKSDKTAIHGNQYGKGEIGEFVFIQTSRHAILGRITQVKLPERDRLAVEPTLGKQAESHPIGTIQLLSTLSLESGEVSGGVAEFPRVGAQVFAAHPDLIKWIAEFAKGEDGTMPLKLNIAYVSGSQNTPISITPEKLFGRHCAVFGSTGSGKSWTIARILESLEGTSAKLILIDATGEYHTISASTTHIHLDPHPQPPPTSTEVVVPYTSISEHELFVLFRPGPGAQGPKLRMAMKSLKLAKLSPSLATGGVIKKAGKSKAAYDTAYKSHLMTIDNGMAEFEVVHLAQQVQEECCWPDARAPQGPSHWGLEDPQQLGYCVSLINRISWMIAAPELACLFQPQGKRSIFDAVDDFMADTSKHVLRVSMSHLPFAFNTREIVANAIGKHLLKLARNGSFKMQPTIVILDEAHNFLSKTIGDELSHYSLDAFESIAREGRKFGLTICLATQRPRDLPESVLSQMGTMIVHRLTNSHDRETVERASGDVDRSAASFLPTLAPGEAVLVGVDFPFPLTVKIIPPKQHPDSRGPNFQALWKPATGGPS